MVFIQPRILRDSNDTTIETNQKYNYIRNEREQEKREAIEREERARKLIQEQAEVLANPRGAPQSSSTLHLLNPSYNKF